MSNIADEVLFKNGRKFGKVWLVWRHEPVGDSGIDLFGAWEHWIEMCHEDFPHIVRRSGSLSLLAGTSIEEQIRCEASRLWKCLQLAIMDEVMGKNPFSPKNALNYVNCLRGEEE